MSIFSAFVLFAMIWAMSFLIALQVKHDTQGDRGERVPGTHDSSPADLRMKPRLFWATAVSLVLWVPLIWLITSGLITIDGIRSLTGRV